MFPNTDDCQQKFGITSNFEITNRKGSGESQLVTYKKIKNDKYEGVYESIQSKGKNLLFEYAGCNLINNDSRIEEIRSQTREYIKTIETPRGLEWWTTLRKKENGDEVYPFESVEKDLYGFYFKSALFYNNEFEHGIARIAIGELNFDMGMQYSTQFMYLKKILKCIMEIDSEYEKYDADLNGMSYDELYNTYSDIIESDYHRMEDRINSAEYVRNPNYNTIRVESYEQAQLFYKYTSPESRWCVCYDEKKYNAYIDNGNNAMYFVLYNGFKDIEKPEIDGEKGGGRAASFVDYECVNDEHAAYLPYDEYGMSMLLITVDPDGRLNCCASRWNHEFNLFARDYLDEEHISNILGVNFYQEFVPVI